MNRARILFAAPASGSGKTTVTCGVLQALKRRGIRLSAFKCGPDFIDPMFHQQVIGVPSGTLDLFFDDETGLRRSFCRHGAGAELSVIEGVMGFYDGWGVDTDQGSTFRIAQTLKAPVVLIVNARGQALSALAELEGFLRFRKDSGIRGVIFNQMSGHVFRSLVPKVREMGVLPIGFVPRGRELAIESRHLGLVTPGELNDLRERLDKLANLLEETLDLDALLSLARTAPPLDCPPERPLPSLPATRIAVARDRAFCFLYRDNLHLLERMGAELRFFSPLCDSALPEGTQGLLLPGGYPELYAGALSENRAMRAEIAAAVRGGLPCLAECGGFLYLHRALEDTEGVYRPMAGVLDVGAYKTDRLRRFGYVTLRAGSDSAYFAAGETIRAHEFHYWDSEDPGSDLTAEKPAGNRSWPCVHTAGNLLAGFPHLWYESNPNLAERFLRRCAKRGGV